MAFTPAQKAQAEQHQVAAAQSPGPQVRLVAGPGTGKTGTIEKRVSWLLSQGVQPDNLFVISFTRVTCAELSQRVVRFCTGNPWAMAAARVRVSTMHSLALRILRKANLLTSYPTSPIMLDDWEQEAVYDNEFATVMGCPKKRAEEIRLAHDAQWQTLSPQAINQAIITQAEIQAFTAFHSSRTNLYSCVLPGEVIFKCVEAMRTGVLQPQALLQMEHLIVDEYQDLNACDQEFIKQLAQGNTVLFIAGDDDQSIYSRLRHADPSGIVNFNNAYPQSVTHTLADCFRCTPAVLNAASNLIQHNPNRYPKTLTPLYANAAPPVHGRVYNWQLPTPEKEAQVIADSCQALIQAGMAGREDDVLILISNRRLQLNLILQELRSRNIQYDAPSALAFADEYESIRAVYSIVRILRNVLTTEQDYPAYRDLLGLLAGVGQTTAKQIGDECITNNQNYREVFHMPALPAWLSARARSAVHRVSSVVQIVGGWAMSDSIASRTQDITNLLSAYVFTKGTSAAAQLQAWQTLATALPPQMTLEELLLFLGADTDAEQEAILGIVAARLAQGQGQQQVATVVKKVRILTMHGSKGLTGSIVFIPSVEQGIMPRKDALQATGLLIEQRRLFYVAISRARACCIVSRSTTRTGYQAQAIANQYAVSLPPSQFLTEMGVQSVQRANGLSPAEANAIVAEVNNL